jgi:hypothetical protein
VFIFGALGKIRQNKTTAKYRRYTGAERWLTHSLFIYVTFDLLF